MITLLYNVFIRSSIVLLFAMLSVNYIPDKFFHDYPFEPKAVETNYDSVVLEWNSKLIEDSKPEYIQLNQIRGPESIAISKAGLIYTGLGDGRLVELDPSRQYKLRRVLKFNPASKCIENQNTHIDECGRFLQLRFQNDTLFAIEAGHGLYKIDIDRGTKMLLTPRHLNKVNFYNSFAFDPQDPNLVYITISSTKWGLQRIIWSILELENSGQIIAMDIKTGKQVIVLDKLMMANGIDTDAKRDQLIFAETTASRISSVPLSEIREAFKLAKDGDKLAAINKKTLISIVPGNPDNIIVDSDTLYIGLPFVKLNGKDIADQLANKPSIKKVFGRLIYGVGQLLEFVNEKLYPHPLLEHSYRELKSGHILYKVVQNDKSGIIKYNIATGAQKFLGSNHFSYLSEATPDGLGNLYLGSFESPFLVKVKA